MNLQERALLHDSLNFCSNTTCPFCRKMNEFKQLPRPSRCAKCLFNRRGLLFLGLFTILVGMTAVVSSKIVWPVILRGISADLIEKVHAIQIEPEIQRPVKFGNTTIIVGNRTEINFPKNYTYNASQPNNPNGEPGWWLYFYWETLNQTNLVPFDKNTTGLHWVLRNITGNLQNKNLRSDIFLGSFDFTFFLVLSSFSCFFLPQSFLYLPLFFFSSFPFFFFLSKTCFR